MRENLMSPDVSIFFNSLFSLSSGLPRSQYGIPLSPLSHVDFDLANSGWSKMHIDKWH